MPDSIMFNSLIFVAAFTVSFASPLIPNVSTQNIKNRVIDGEYAPIESFPYQVSFFEKKLALECSGTIISDEWVITSASCVYEKILAKLFIRAGSNIFYKSGSVHQIDNIILHPNYFWGNHRYRCDIALVHVNNPFDFDETRQPISMFEMDEKLAPETTAIISGWGGDGFFADVHLQSKKMSIIAKKECTELYPSGVYNAENQICVSHPVACRGDNGGPLTVDGRLAGILSAHTNCKKSKPNTPSMHTEIGPFRPWIKSVTGF